MLIDHCHVGAAGFGQEKARPEVGTLPELRRILDAAGVDAAVVFAPFRSRGLGWDDETAAKYSGPNGPNEWLVDELKAYPRLRGFATIHPGEAGAADRVVQSADMGLVGLKFHPAVFKAQIDAPQLDAYFSAAEQAKMPVEIHTGAHGWRLRKYMPILIDDVAQSHPELPIIVTHLGGVAFFHQALAVLHNNKNCYAGLTQCSGRDPRYELLPERLKLLLDTVGPDRIIYGLDHPWNQDNLRALREDLEWVHSWGVPESDCEKILGGNLERLTSRG